MSRAGSADGPVDRSRYLTRTRIRALLERHDLAPSRALGQNFLCDPSTVDKIVRLSGVGSGDRVLEIGAGLGSLTVGLAAAGAEVHAVEVDRHLVGPLSDVVDGLGVTVHQTDVRAIDWPKLLGDGSWHVVANLPYNIATPLILDLLAAQPQLARWLVMVQREAGERLAASAGSKVYGIPSVLTSFWADARVVASVNPELFLPKPRVESVLVEIVRRDNAHPEVGFERLADLVRAGFGQRRKMLRRSLADRVDSTDLVRAGIDPTWRAEQLSIDDWCRLAAVVHR